MKLRFMSKLQALYDFAKENLNELYTKHFRFIFMPQELLMADDQYYIQAQLTNETIPQPGQYVILLKQWKLQNNGDQIIVIIYEFEKIKETFVVQQLQPFVPQIQNSSTQQEQIEQQRNYSFSQFHGINQIVEELKHKRTSYLDIHGRIIKKSDRYFKPDCQYFLIDIIDQSCRSLTGIIFQQENLYDSFIVNQTYEFSNVEVSLYKNGDPQFKFNEYSRISKNDYDFPYSISQKMKTQNIAEILNGNLKRNINLIGIIQQKIFEGPQRITYIVCDKSGSIYLTFWNNNCEHIVKQFKDGQLVALKNLKYSIGETQSYLNAWYHTDLLQNYESETVNELKLWTLTQQFQELSLSEPIYSISQLKQCLNFIQIKPLQCFGYIYNLSNDMTYIACSECFRKMTKLGQDYYCEVPHTQQSFPITRFFLNVLISDSAENIEISIPNKQAVQLLGINAEDFMKLDDSIKFQVVGSVKNKMYGFQMYKEQKEYYDEKYIVTKIQPYQSKESQDENTQRLL